ncbi:MAG: hypothetical protein LBV02_03345 [Bacteroidales bacterium]|jgi:hypothetical protein|nr:hypothetical protein [Bacteroidales bacterium]
MTVNYNKTYFVTHFTKWGIISYALGYISYVKDMIFLLPLVIIFGIASLCFLCMLIRSFFEKAIELNAQTISISFLFSKKMFQLSSISTIDLDKKQIFILNDKGKMKKCTLEWVAISDLCKIKKMTKT